MLACSMQGQRVQNRIVSARPVRVSATRVVTVRAGDLSEYYTYVQNQSSKHTLLTNGLEINPKKLFAEKESAIVFVLTDP